jgi:hypothetical protein
MVRLKIALMILGGVVGFFGIQEWRLATAAKPTPQRLSAAQLVDKGPGKNAHILLTNYTAAGNDFVYEENKRTHKWQKVWIPLQPDGGLFGLQPGGPVRILFKSKKASGEGDLAGIFMGLPPLKGMIVNKIESLGREEKDLLRARYPSIDFDHCYIFEHDRSPASTAQVVGLMGGGGFLILLGMAWVAADMKKA